MMSGHRNRGLAGVIGALALATAAYAAPPSGYEVDGACNFRIGSSASGSGNRVQLTVVGIALPSVQPGVVTSTIRCEVLDRTGRVVFDRTSTAAGAGVVSDTVEVANVGPFVICATARAAWNTGQVVTDPRSCIS